MISVLKTKGRQKKLPLMTFMEMVKRGLVTWDEVDDFIDLWHKSDTKYSLHEFLGMSLDQYKLWSERPELSYHISYV